MKSLILALTLTAVALAGCAPGVITDHRTIPTTEADAGAE